MNIAFRVDVSKEIGFGHLMRSLALAEELKKHGNNCYIFSKIYDDKILEKIKKFEVGYCNMESKTNDEVNELIKLSLVRKVDWIITDSYRINSEYIKKLKEEKFKVLSIDDNALIHYYSDIVVNQNIGAEKLDFSAEKYAKLLLGTNYVIMRDELLRRNEKKEKSQVKKILVTMGGSDQDNITLKILQALKEIHKDIEVLVVIGPLNPFYDDLIKFVKDFDFKVILLRSPDDMAEIYLESDIAISAGGTSCYELAYFGIPNIIITIADNQLKIAKELDKQKASIYLGKKSEVTADQIIGKVTELINNISLRKIMSQNGENLVDGQGKKRIIDKMECYN